MHFKLSRLVFALPIVFLAPLSPIAFAQATGGQSTPQSEASRLTLRAVPLHELHFWVRAMASGEAPLADNLQIRQAVEAAKKLGDSFENPSSWSFIEGAIADARSIAQVRTVFDTFPEMRPGSDPPVPFRAPAQAYAQALSAAWAWYLDNTWFQRRGDLARAATSLSDHMSTGRIPPIHHLLSCLEMEDPNALIVVSLTSTAPAPGHLTTRGPSGPICYISLFDLSKNDLTEKVFLEVARALDVLTIVGPPSAPSRLRQALVASGIKAEEAIIRDALLALFQIQAAETVRKCIDPNHVDADRSATLGPDVQALVEVQRPIWKSHLEGEITLDDAVNRMVEQVLKRREARNAEPASSDETTR